MGLRFRRSVRLAPSAGVVPISMRAFLGRASTRAAASERLLLGVLL